MGQLLGSGSFGTVSRGRLRASDVAVKVLKDCAMGEVSAWSSILPPWNDLIDAIQHEQLNMKAGETLTAEVEIINRYFTFTPALYAIICTIVQLISTCTGIGTTDLCKLLVFVLTLGYQWSSMSWWLGGLYTHISTWQVTTESSYY